MFKERNTRYQVQAFQNRSKIGFSVAAHFMAGYLLAHPANAWAQSTPAPSTVDSIIEALAKNGDKEKVTLLNLDLALPESPAFTVLGLTPETVVRPNNLRELATTFINGVDQRGNLQTGFALDISPFRLTQGQRRLTIHEYRKNYGAQLLRRTRVSVATAVGSSDNDKAARAAVGFTLTLFDQGDPILDKNLIGESKLGNPAAKPGLLEKAFTDLGAPITPGERVGAGAPPAPPRLKRNPSQQDIDAYLRKVTEYAENIKEYAEKLPPPVMRLPEPPAPPEDPTLPAPPEYLSEVKAYVGQLEDVGITTDRELDRPVLQKRQEAYKQAIEEAFAEAKNRNWNGTSLMIGFAPSFISTSSSLGKLKGDSTGFWTSYAQKIGNSAQLLLHARSMNGQTVPNPETQGQFFKQDSNLFGTRLRVGSPDLNFSLEGAAIDEKPSGSGHERYQRISFGTEFKVSTNYWLALSVGGDRNRSTGSNSFILGALKWGFNSSPTLR